MDSIPSIGSSHNLGNPDIQAWIDAGRPTVDRDHVALLGWLMDIMKCSLDLQAILNGNPNTRVWTNDKVEPSVNQVFSHTARVCRELTDKGSMDLNTTAHRLEDIAQGRASLSHPPSNISTTTVDVKDWLATNVPIFETNVLSDLDCIFIGDSASVMAGHVKELREHLRDILNRYFLRVSVDIAENRQWCTIGPTSTGFAKLPIGTFGGVDGFYDVIRRHARELYLQNGQMARRPTNGTES